MKTVLAKLVAKEIDTLNYVTYVFECLEEEVIKYTKYIMCVRWPNWDHRNIDIDEIGFLSFIEIQAGITTWFNGEKMIPYNYDNIQFIKFINKPEKKDHKYIMN